MGMEAHYRSLGLKPGASREQIKSAYRALAREFHPDTRDPQLSPQQSAKIEAQFLAITQAYKHLMAKHPPDIAVTLPKPTANEKLKYQTYQRLRQLFAHHRFANAIALVEALAARFPEDPEVRQWCAIAYQQQGLRLIQEKHYGQATRYLQKAIATDPTNRPLKLTTHRALQTIQRLTRSLS
jgi:tetratricopeptide (TPR) repeat protein